VNFATALAGLAHFNRRAMRAEWQAQNMWLFLVRDWMVLHPPTTVHAPGRMLPFLCLKNTDGKYVPWLASQNDMLANDWIVIDAPSVLP
jgi:hypothetical protein